MFLMIMNSGLDMSRIGFSALCYQKMASSKDSIKERSFAGYCSRLNELNGHEVGLYQVLVV